MRRPASRVLAAAARDVPTFLSSRTHKTPQAGRSFSRSHPLRDDESKPPHPPFAPPPQRQGAGSGLASVLSSMTGRPTGSPVGSAPPPDGQGPATAQPPPATQQQQLEALSRNFMRASETGKGSLKQLDPGIFRLDGAGAGGEGKADDDGLGLGQKPVDDDSEEPYHFHIYSHKQNTHVLLTRPNRSPLISLSCGNLGFRHAQRKTYDAAYQLGAYAITKMTRMGIVDRINNLEIILRGFGAGRDAVTKVLLSNEGSILRDKVIKVSDATVIRFGGPRAPNPRRI